MDRSRKSKNDRPPWSPAEVPRRRRCAPRRTNMTKIRNFGSILALTMLTAASVSSTHVPDKYPIEVYHMLREKTQFNLGRDNRIRGTWGPWSAWSECSRTCGTGIQSQSRECVPYQRLLRKRSIISENGTSNSRPICIGTYKRYHTCNTQKCPNFPEDLRAEQCAKYNGRNYKGESYDWVPFLDVPNSCALNCRAVGERFYATLEPAVMDGAPCDAPNLRGHNTGISMERTDRWLCVAGQCKSVGCDGVVGSGVTMDACGVCGGQGKGCRLYEGIFMEPILPRGHQPVTTIPKGAMSLNISELRFSSNFLALKDSNGSYILNGPLAYSPSGTYKAAGTTLTYQRGDKNRMECILATGPLNDSLHLEILAQEMNPGVLYKYMMPFNGKPVIAPPFFPIGSVDRGNEIPDSDARIRPTFPVTRISNQKADLSPTSHNQDRARAREKGRKEEMRHSPTTVMAGDQPKSKNKKKKRLRFSWKMFGVTPCSKECGGGVQTAIFKCFRENRQMIVNDKRCRSVEKPQQPPPLRCNDNPCPPRWRAEPWGECSVSCGIGTRSRKLECVQELNANLTMRVAAGACVQPPDLRSVETCTKPACTNGPELRHMHSQHDTPRWDVGAWGPCSTTCGTGIRNRTVTCITSGDACSAFNKPDSRKICESAPCMRTGIEHSAPWLYSEWSSKCSAECGSGVETRQVACADGSELFCNPKERPETERQCFGRESNCDSAKWFTGPWSFCSVSCGVGVQYREVLCVARTNKELVVSPASNCNGSRPANEQVCRASACTPTWFTSNWSKCSVTCGTGVQTRLVRCILEGVSNSNCEDVAKPSGHQQCSLDPCKKDPSSSSKPPKKAYEASSECVDKHPNCALVVKNGLCRIKYYKYSCCRCRE
ncbi:thrombospondin type-1 domain-containing protein 4-like [Bombus impatiens]|uniref:Thrombospondin type-1 domain-containing protein 4-like n=2 Tax=Pyrobombus TaxID=144703 RepID=A0A6P8MB90_9HYME|nr:thrombospondin type-1 domain-containing protein 4-like [Bombus impatiens]XP_033188568.1 thrombospondin type-1 domain-containing protein 4-like [Bombus vancouverensis nearcticus]XP_033307034.1 thrombospondin type-1 domain-containing protein 4-like [Bombus bifarius]